ncbi:hypothetical protein C5167_033200 [Papaver somniferum]|uniref:Uncharacterized protein n=1 Tax=Papaver somniferum TaxID=3469 RepID=A0A4Y7KD49_PAPSO|nr:hypothetical protein C5167_033200 [Papaver somniferum]
MWISRYIFCW